MLLQYLKRWPTSSNLKDTLEGGVMGFDEKVDVIDLIINVLREHEKTLDALISQLERILSGAAPLPAAVEGPEARRPMVSVLLRGWREFRERCAGASLTAFDIEDKQFRVSAVKDDVLYSYQEQMPDMDIRLRERDEKTTIEGIDLLSSGLVPTVLRGKLECGLEVSVRGVEVKMPNGVIVYKVIYDIDPDGAKEWLANQLRVEKKDIMQGKIQI